MNRANSITDVPGLLVGHAQDDQALTGCTVILCAAGAVCGVDQRGGAPGTRETDLLRPLHLVNKVHAILLSGGSAFGLDAASGVMRYLEERKIGFDVRLAKIPIVPAAILFDPDIGNPAVREGPMAFRPHLEIGLAWEVNQLYTYFSSLLKACRLFALPQMQHYETKKPATNENVADFQVPQSMGLSKFLIRKLRVV